MNNKILTNIAIMSGLAMSSGIYGSMFPNIQPYKSDWKHDTVRLSKAEEKRKRKLNKTMKKNS